MTLGAVSGGVLMQIGRRDSLFVCLTIGAVGTLTTLDINSFALINIGRFLFGFSSGLYTSITPKFLGETIPDHLGESFISGFVAAQALGAFIGNLFVFVLPKED